MRNSDMLIHMNEDLKKNFFILEEKDGTHSAYIRFGGFTDKKEAQFVIDTIMIELGLIKVEQQTAPTIH